MFRHSSLFWGLIPLGVVVWAGLSYKGPMIEQHLDQIARAEAAKQGADWAKFSIDGRDVTISGVAPNAEAAGKLKEAIGALQGVRLSRLGVDVAQSVTPYVTRFVREAGKRIVATGYAPSEKARDALMSDIGARLAGFELVDEITIANGAPRQWADAAADAATALSLLASGSATLIGDTIYYDGAAGSVAETEKARRDLAASVPGGMTAVIALAPQPVSPFTWSARIDQAQVRLDGHVPDDRTRASLFAAAQRLFAGRVVVDAMRVAAGAPDGWPAVAELALRPLTRMHDGMVTIADRAITVSGKALTRPARDSIMEAFGAMPTAFPVTAEVAVAEAGETLAAGACQELIDKVLRSGAVDFPPGMTNIAPHSLPIVDELAYVASRCPDSRLEISGHTGSANVVDDDWGRTISLRRAEAVIEALVGAGIARVRLSARGVGAEKPLADGADGEGRARNRRIEVTVVR